MLLRHFRNIVYIFFFNNLGTVKVYEKVTETNTRTNIRMFVRPKGLISAKLIMPFGKCSRTLFLG